MEDVVKALEAAEKVCLIMDHSDSHVDVRCDIKNPEEAQDFVRIYGSITKTDWIVCYKSQYPQRMVMRKLWLCDRSSKNKRRHSVTIRNEDCQARINMKIKKFNVNTRKKDHFLKWNPPLVCKLSIFFTHSHVPTSLESLQRRRVSDATKTIFCEYFEKGMKPRDAKRHHEKILKEENTSELIFDKAVNPTMSQVYALHAIWKKAQIQPEIKIQEVMSIPEQVELKTVVKKKPKTVKKKEPKAKKRKKMIDKAVQTIVPYADENDVEVRKTEDTPFKGEQGLCGLFSLSVQEPLYPPEVCN